MSEVPPPFAALIVGQAAVLVVFARSGIGYLWYNVIGCAVVVGVALAIPPRRVA